MKKKVLLFPNLLLLLLLGVNSCTIKKNLRPPQPNRYPVQHHAYNPIKYDSLMYKMSFNNSLKDTK